MFKKQSTSLPLSNFVEIMYGGQSITFQKHVTGAFQADLEKKKAALEKNKSRGKRRSKTVARRDDFFQFYSWECVSLVTVDATTLDFVISDCADMMAFLSIMSRHIYKLKEDTQSHSMMRIFSWLKLKMKLAHEAFMSSVEMKDVVAKAIHQTVAEKSILTRSNLQKFIQNENGMSNTIKDKYSLLLQMENDTSQRENLESLTAKCLIKLEDGMKVKQLTSYITKNSNLDAYQCEQLSELIRKFSESRDQVD